MASEGPRAAAVEASNHAVVTEGARGATAASDGPRVAAAEWATCGSDFRMAATLDGATAMVTEVGAWGGGGFGGLCAAAAERAKLGDNGGLCKRRVKKSVYTL
ncbi:hypothetical protein GUJ93_ZPchr0010g8239 [Zizania palustris]|uniref:Uncharacterized protein n=1 Tax=Zizania palustris TaxID=103762 RepID=A0A8J6BGN0_ZIZPA|nr:hypothetical protein GUJ93_ZPchr0010g8239 [Zizania palustris]